MSEVKTTRVSRVERELLETLSSFLQHNLAARLPCFASITAVDVAGDLRKARVYFRLVGEDKAVAETKTILEGERARFQKHAAVEVKMKFTPVLRFEFGVAPHLDEIDELFENLRKPKHGFED